MQATGIIERANNTANDAARWRHEAAMENGARGDGRFPARSHQLHEGSFAPRRRFRNYETKSQCKKKICDAGDVKFQGKYIERKKRTEKKQRRINVYTRAILGVGRIDPVCLALTRPTFTLLCLLWSDHLPMHALLLQKIYFAIGLDTLFRLVSGFSIVRNTSDRKEMLGNNAA